MSDVNEALRKILEEIRSIKASLESLDQRVKVLEDREAIKELKARYCYSLDRRDYDSVLDLFAEDAVADFGPFSKCRGKKQLEKFFKEITPRQQPFWVHMVHSPVIEIEGDRARGRWYLEEANILGGEAVWMQGLYEEEYIKIDGSWKFKSITLRFNYITPYDKGWAKERMKTSGIEPGISE